MEHITHYKYVIEKYLKDEIVKNEILIDGDYSFDEEELMAPIKRKSPKYIIEEISVDKLKKAMSNNEYVSIERTTITVSEDIVKNTISLKLYKFKKDFIKVPFGERRRFKIRTKTLFSLSINKTNGHFSVYTRKKSGRKYITFVRKNISNPYIRKIINGCSYEFNEDSIKIFYKLLGYHSLGLNYSDIIEYFFYNANIEHNYRKSYGLHVFPILNYLRVNDINILDYNIFYYFESIFRKNKTKYSKCSIIDYMSDYYGIEDRELLRLLIFRLIYLNKNIEPTSNKRKIGMELDGFFKINYTMLRLFYDLNTNHIYEVTSYFDHIFILDYYITDDEINSYPTILNLLKTYKNPSVHFNTFLPSNQKDFATFKGNLKLLNFFGVKLKIRNFYEYHLLRNEYDKIINNLFEAVNVSGTYVIDKKFINRLKLYFKGCKIEFKTNIKIKKKSDTIAFFLSKDVNTLYDKSDLNIVIKLVDDKQNTLYIRVFPFSQTLHYQQTESKSGIISRHNFNHAFYNNKNGLASALKLKLVYSKRYFEKLCSSDGIKVSSLIDYYGNNG